MANIGTPKGGVSGPGYKNYAKSKKRREKLEGEGRCFLPAVWGRGKKEPLVRREKGNRNINDGEKTELGKKLRNELGGGEGGELDTT